MNLKSIEKIVLPLDGSDLAATAMPWAGLISSNTHASIDLVSAVSADDEPTNLSTLANRLEKSKSKLQSQSPHVSAFAEEGNPPAVIAAHVQRTNADLIVMASHGYSGAIERLLGSVSFWLLRLTTTPVMIVKPQSGPPVVQKILYPLGGGISEVEGLELAAGLARDLSTPLSLVHITESSYSAPEKVERYMQALAEQNIEAEVHVEQGEPKERITQIVNDQPGTLVVLESATSTGIDLTKTGSFAEHLFIHTTMPTIVLSKVI